MTDIIAVAREKAAFADELGYRDHANTIRDLADEIESLRSLATQHHQGGDRLEQAACLISDALDYVDVGPIGEEYSRKIAASVLALAQQPLSVTTGWQLVPVEPTEAMLDVYWRQAGESKEMRSRYHGYARGYYANLLAAAPTVGGTEE